MKVAYVSVQQQEEGFRSDIPVSYACIQKQNWEDTEEVSFGSIVERKFAPDAAETCKFYLEDEMPEFFNALSDVNLIVVFNLRYLVNLISKYYHEDCHLTDDFTFFDIQDMIIKQTHKGLRPSIMMLGDTFGSPRMVSNGLAFVGFWERGDLAMLRKCMDRDIEILRLTFKNIMQSSGFEVSHTMSGEKYEVNTLGWRQQILNTYSRSFEDRCLAVLRQIKGLAINKREGLERRLISNSKMAYLEKTGEVHIVFKGDGTEMVLHKSLPSPGSSEYLYSIEVSTVWQGSDPK